MKNADIGKIVDGAIGIGSLGLIGVNSEGGLQAGTLVHGADELIGGVFGRNVARKGLMDNEDAEAQAEAAQQKQITATADFNENQQRAASSAAQANQNAALAATQGTSSGTFTGNTSSGGSPGQGVLGGATEDEKNFLGL